MREGSHITLIINNCTNLQMTPLEIELSIKLFCDFHVNLAISTSHLAYSYQIYSPFTAEKNYRNYRNVYFFEFPVFEFIFFNCCGFKILCYSYSARLFLFRPYIEVTRKTKLRNNKLKTMMHCILHTRGLQFVGTPLYHNCTTHGQVFHLLLPRDWPPQGTLHSLLLHPACSVSLSNCDLPDAVQHKGRVATYQLLVK